MNLTVQIDKFVQLIYNVIQGEPKRTMLVVLLNLKKEISLKNLKRG